MVVAGDLIILLLGIIVPSSRLYAAYIRDDEHPESIDVCNTVYISIILLYLDDDRRPYVAMTPWVTPHLHNTLTLYHVGLHE